MPNRSQLEEKLASLADDIDWPEPSPRFGTQVVALIEAPPAKSHDRGRRRLAAVLAVVVLFTWVALFSPAARQAVADLFGAAGIRISVTSDTGSRAGAGLNLGDPIQLQAAVEEVDFIIRAPVGDEPGPPDGVYLDTDRRVSMVWTGTETLPAAGDSGVALLLIQYRIDIGPHVAEKAVGPETEALSITVDGVPALWIEGAPHTFTLLDAQGSPVTGTTRLAANVLLWESRGVNYRLETTGGLDSALSIVERLQRLP